ncbi:MAG: NUDIX domain-containing protein [Agathobacter sp.]|nr:NUDIX domain-containing protein [Agathobacter sp.]
MEILDVVDDNGIPTGRTVERERAHREGVQHRTAHLWIARRRDGQVELLLQKRSRDKDSFPGCYDISSAGHIPAGVDYIPSALRELKEELGVTAAEKDLILCGKRRLVVHSEFHHTPYNDYQVCAVYLMWLDWDEEQFSVQTEEIESVKWMEFEACKKAVIEDTMPNCIDIEELAMLEVHFHDI